MRDSEPRFALSNIMGLGIGIIAHQEDSCHNCLKAIQAHTQSPFKLVIAANDGFSLFSDVHSLPVVTGHEFSNTWHQNRALAYLLHYTKCDPILLMEDNCWPVEDGWERTWIEAVKRWQHLNSMDHTWFEETMLGGSGQVHDPYWVKSVSGYCSISTRAALEKVGYLDTRLNDYQHASSEWTSRFMRTLGYWNGKIPALNSGLRCSTAQLCIEFPMESSDAAVLQELKDAPVYRAPFHGRVEQERFYRDLKRAHWPVAPESGTTRLISVICPLSEVKAATSIADAIGRAAINSHAVSVPYEMIWVWYGEGTCSLPGLVVEHLETPFVYAEAANRGVMASSGEVLLFLNEQGALDTPNALQDLLSLFAEQPGSDVCYVYHSGEWQPRESPDYLDREHECWAIRRHTFCSLGGLKEVATSIEDIELRANSTSTILSLAPQQSTAVLGIGITTYNRLEALAGCVKRIQKHTRHDYQLVIADDGSTDGTVEWARQQGLRIITGENRGLAWNRNRALHYLEEYTRCDPLILLDDDCWPCEDGWEQTWREAALRWGHVDHAFAPSVVKSGRGTAQDPYICSGSSGNCCTTSRAALRVVGYQDLRLAQGWGYDDSEWTMRFSRALAQERDMAPDVQLCLSHGIRMMEFGTWCDQEKLAQNRNVFLELLEEQTVWRPAWQTEGEQETLKGEVIKAIQHRRMQAQNVLYTPRGLIAPTETADCQPRWEGRICPKPWEYTVSAIIPHLETPEPLRTCIEILRLQTERPYIFVVDTGSSAATMTELESLRAADVEIHYIRSHAFRHSSEPVGVAQDLAFALCHSEYLFCTHADCFLRRRDYIEWLLTLCNAECPAVGYQMSPRDWLTNDWEGMVSHTATLLHMPTMWRLGASWNFERAHTQFGVPRQAMGWPDTETCMNMVLQAAGVKPLLIGNETNYERYVDENVDHPRSFAGSKFYGAEYHVKAQTWMEDALREARERIAGWKSGHNI